MKKEEMIEYLENLKDKIDSQMIKTIYLHISEYSANATENHLTDKLNQIDSVIDLINLF